MDKIKKFHCGEGTFIKLIFAIFFLIPTSAFFFTFSVKADDHIIDYNHSISRTEFLRLVEVLISRGQLDKAKRLVNDLPEDAPLANDKLFLSAKIAEAEGDYKLAEKLYRTILRDNPDLHRVRLDLARSLYSRGNFDAADYHFRLVLAADIPDEVRRNIRPFLNRIREERWWAASFSFAVVPDSNINTGPNVKTVTILGQPFQLSDDATETSGVGLQSTFDAEFRPRISDNTRIVLGANVFRHGAARSTYLISSWGGGSPWPGLPAMVRRGLLQPGFWAFGSGQL